MTEPQEEEAGVGVFDPQDAEEMLSALLDLAARVTELERRWGRAVKLFPMLSEEPPP